MSCKRDTVVNGMKDVYGADRVSKVMTLQTEKSRSAILSAARGLGMDNDLASYIASLVVFDRGTPRTLKQMYYGDKEAGIKSVGEFVREMDEHSELWETAQKIEGLVCGVGSHAGGVIIVDKPFTETTALMRTRSGDIITQFDLHMAEDCSLIKIDLLAIDALDKIYETLMLLLEDGVIEWQGTLKDTYEKYIGIYSLERDAEDMWKLLWDHKVLSLFQMEKESGKQAIALSKPSSVDDLATLNSVIRLMAQEPGGETPLRKFARYKENITQWYNEMTLYGLTEYEQKILKEILETSYGICEAQEYLFLLTMHPEIGGFDLKWADKLRKAVAKKNPRDFDKLQEEYFDNANRKGLSQKLVNYVWKELIFTQRGYGFNKSHVLAYSLIGLQELNLAYKYNILYWNTANLIVDSGSLDEESNDSTNYGKMGVAIAKIQQENVPISLPVINDAKFGFKPDTENNRIIFGLKGINGINTDVSKAIIKNRPFTSMDDFAEKMLEPGLIGYGDNEEPIYAPSIIKPNQMLQLIKGGCFTELHSSDRTQTMDWYLRKYKFKKANKLTMVQYKKLAEWKVIPEHLLSAAQMVEFKKYVLDDEALYEKYVDTSKKTIPKKGYHEGYYILDNNSQPFFIDNFKEDSIIRVVNGYYLIAEKKFIKEVDSYIQPLKDWLSTEEALDLYNQTLYKQIWNEYASGTLPSWTMQSLCYYDGEHELEHIQEEKYGIVNFFELSEEPEPYQWYPRFINGQKKMVPKYKISRIAGTVLQADNNHHTVALLTKYGPVNVKMNKGHYSFYNKRISQIDSQTGKKKVLEKSWLQRGSLIIVAGIRRGDQFSPMVYKDTIYNHTVNLIKEVYEDGSLLLQNERVKIKS